jgi:HK97 family phage prohead protease
MSTRDLQGQRFERLAVLETREANADARTVPAALSSETPVKRPWGREILVHDAAAVDMTRAADGLPLLWNHDTGAPIGRVENVRLKDGKLRGTLRFSRNARAEEVFQDVRDGFLKDISIGYQIDRWEESADSDDVRVTGWGLLEASVVTVPADASVGMHRSLTPQEGKPMTDSVETPTVAPEVASAPIVDIGNAKRAHNLAKKAGAVEAIKAERQRIADLHELFDLDLVPRNDFYSGLRVRAVDEGWSLEGARKILMEVLSGEVEPAADWSTVDDQRHSVRVATHEQLPAVVVPDRGQRKTLGGTIQTGANELDKFREGVTHGLLVRSGVLDTREAIDKAREGGMVGKSLRTLAGEFCRMVGISTNGLSDEDMAGRALAFRAAHGATTSDFVNILANVANKSLLQGWDEAPETWMTWTRRGTLPDFKTAEISGISGFTSLDEVPEDGDITYGKFTDRKETIKLVSYAKKYRVSRRLIINDDLQALAAIPRAMGRAANRKVGDITYAMLNIAGPVLNQDSILLFDTATHKNYVALATGPTVATLDTANVAMARQTDPNSGATLNIIPRYLVVPKTLENTARVLMAAQYDPAGTAGTLPPNPFSGRYEVVSDARLDGQTEGTRAWYLFADPNIFDTFEVSFLNGMAEPYMRENQEWDGQGVSYAVGVDFGVAALDFRGVHKYKGAT